VLATSLWGLISSYFSKKIKDAQPPAAAPFMPNASDEERASFQKWRAGQNMETR
jgi:hypothetical protein